MKIEESLETPALLPGNSRETNKKHGGSPRCALKLCPCGLRNYTGRIIEGEKPTPASILFAVTARVRIRARKPFTNSKESVTTNQPSYVWKDIIYGPGSGFLDSF